MKLLERNILGYQQSFDRSFYWAMYISGRFDNKDRLTMAVMFHLLDECFCKYDQYMLMIEAWKSCEEYDKILKSITSLLVYLHLLFQYNEISRMCETGLDDETLTLYLEKMMGKEYRDYLRVTRKMAESTPNCGMNAFKEDSRRGYLGVLDLFKLRTSYVQTRLALFAKRTMDDLDSTESETVRLWLGVFRSDEAVKFLTKKYPMLGNDDRSTLSLKTITEKEYEDLFPILLKIPERISKDSEDFYRLSVRAKSMVYGLGLSVYENKDHVMDPDEDLSREFSSKVVPFEELMEREDVKNNRPNKFSRSRTRPYESGLWNWNEKQDRWEEVQKMDLERRMNISDSENKWRKRDRQPQENDVHRSRTLEELLSQEFNPKNGEGFEPGIDEESNNDDFALDIDEEIIDGDCVRLDKGHETDEEDEVCTWDTTDNERSDGTR